MTLVGCGDSEEAVFAGGVTRSERVWVDTSRATPPTQNYTGAPQRTLRVVLWQPTATRRLPLFVMAHGFGGLPEKFEAFARTIAAAGFVVAAPAFPLTNQNAPGGHDVGLGDLVNQPGDLSFVITRLLEADQSPGDALHERIVAEQIAVLGHSLGGATLLALTRKNCCRDTRVAASVLFAAVPLFQPFGSDPINAGPPTLVLHGTADHTVAYSGSLQLYNNFQPPRFFVGIKGASHSDPLESQADPPIAARDLTQRATIAFLNATFRGADAALASTLEGIGAAGNTVKLDRGSPP